MWNKRIGWISGLLFLLVCSCATEQTVTKKQVRKDAFGRNLNFRKEKGEDGSIVMKSDKRSSFEGRRSNIVRNRDFSGKNYRKKSYRKERWEGVSHFSKKEFQGSRDASRYQKEPWFVKKQAGAQGKQFDVGKKKFFSNPFKTKPAIETTRKSITHTSDAETDFRRRVYVQPKITGWKNQSSLSVDDTNKMLGR